MNNQLNPDNISNNSLDFINVLDIPEDLRNKVSSIENKLLSLCNINSDFIYEDIYYDNNNKNIFLHTLRSKDISPSKPNFILIHGWLGSSTNYLALCSYLKDKYNIFAPDTIGMALSARPQVKFTSTKQCTDYFIDEIEKWREKLNINEFYLAGHSIGGYFAGAYSLKYPSRIKKVLLLSPAGITNIDNGGWIHKQAGCCFGCALCCLWPLWCCEPRCQQLYNCYLCTPVLKLMFRIRYKTSFEINELMAQLSEIAMEYPSDLDKCMWYVFKNPFPTANSPLEDLMLNSDSKLKYIIVFGETDWMDQAGSRRLEEKDSERFKVFIVSRDSHVFIMENAKELSEIVKANFK